MSGVSFGTISIKVQEVQDTSGVTIADCKKLWKKRKKLIGKIAEVECNDKSLDGSLLAGKFVRIRDDK